MMDFKHHLEKAAREGEIPSKLFAICLQLYESYSYSMRSAGYSRETYDPLFLELLHLLKKQVASPFQFAPFHHKITQPYDYYQFGMDFIRPLVDLSLSHIEGLEMVVKIREQIAAGENVILFANHQTEIDPQLLSLLLENDYPHLAADSIFVAGDRVISDPLAIPFSMGRNLLCIYSKRHIDTPPHKREEKLQHNHKTMQKLKGLLSEGKKFIYVAPSGGRDRAGPGGEIVVAPFDPQSIEMFRLIAKQSSQKVHFYPLSLSTYNILPPPQVIEAELGEERRATRDGVLFFFGQELDMETFPSPPLGDKKARRIALATYIGDLVKNNYYHLQKIAQEKKSNSKIDQS